MTKSSRNETALKRAIIFSLILHALLFTLIAVAPSLPKPAEKGMIHYVTFGSLPGGGGGGGGEKGGGGGDSPKPAATPAAEKETLRDLTVASKVKPETKPSMTYPTDAPKKDKKADKEKKAAISKPRSGSDNETPNAGKATASGKGPGSGLRIGLGDGSGGSGFGSGYGDQVGLASFPYQYYLQIISDRVSAGWFTSFVDPGVVGTYYTTVYFKIQRSGQISDLKVAESSGIASLDLSAQRAIQRASPFPPLPTDYEGAYLGIHLIFEHSK